MNLHRDVAICTTTQPTLDGTRACLCTAWFDQDCVVSQPTLCQRSPNAHASKYSGVYVISLRETDFSFGASACGHVCVLSSHLSWASVYTFRYQLSAPAAGSHRRKVGAGGFVFLSPPFPSPGSPSLLSREGFDHLFLSRSILGVEFWP